MNIRTVAQNLRNKITGKEELLKEMIQLQYDMPHIEARAWSVTMEFVEINITELKKILADVELCAKQASDDSWITNPDRMGGGGWTADEIDPNRGWK